jgi:hypothetical protein
LFITSDVSCIVVSLWYDPQERDPIERIRKLILTHDLATEKELKVILWTWIAFLCEFWTILYFAFNYCYILVMEFCPYLSLSLSLCVRVCVRICLEEDSHDTMKFIAKSSWLNLKWICIAFLYISGYWKRSEKTSRRSHCSSQGKNHVLFQFSMLCDLVCWKELFPYLTNNSLAFGILKFSMVLMPLFFFFPFQLFLQESPMPDPSELFTNVYVKGLGVEVIKVSFLLDRLSVNQLLFVPRHIFSSRIVLNIKNLSVFYFFFLQFLAFKNL